MHASDELTRLEGQLRSAFEGPAWHGPADLVLRRMRGDGRQLTPAEDWPTMAKPTDANWQEAIAALRGRNEAMRAAVLRFEPARLSAPLVPEPPYTAYEQFIGLTQHDLYHGGQIALLKRAIRG
jgi:hypothetical protein